MAKLNVYEIQDLIQWSLDKGYFKSWNKACNLFDYWIDLGNEIRLRTYSIFELESEREERDEKFTDYLLEYMKEEGLEEISFIRG